MSHTLSRFALALLLASGLSAFALAQQAPPSTPPPAAPAETPTGDEGVLGAPSPDTGGIDEILEGEEEVLSGSGGFSYDPGNRRDPFKSLLAGNENTVKSGPRPEGIPGLLIDEIDLLGIWRTPRGYVAQVKASNKSYLLREGDQLFDGDVVNIHKDEVVFKQQVQDPTALKPFREVVKSLNPPQT
ncbi:MAG: hypothetical protein ABUT39_08310 [Acidobacteriota bacterium]